MDNRKVAEMVTRIMVAAGAENGKLVIAIKPSNGNPLEDVTLDIGKIDPESGVGMLTLGAPDAALSARHAISARDTLKLLRGETSYMLSTDERGVHSVPIQLGSPLDFSKDEDHVWVLDCLISPTTGEKYTVYDALMKGLVRGGIGVDSLSLEVVSDTEYGDYDAKLHLEEFGPSQSQWCDSVYWDVFGDVPVHVSCNNDWSFGYGTQTKDWNPERGSGWDGVITFRVGAAFQTVYLRELSIPDREVFTTVVGRLLRNMALNVLQSEEAERLADAEGDEGDTVEPVAVTE